MRFEAWTVPWDSAGFERVVADIPATSGKGLVRFNDFGEGAISFPATVVEENGDESFNVDRVISSTVGRLIRVYDGSTVIQEFLAERVERSVEDEVSTVTISGGDLDTIFDRTILYPFDYPDSPSLQPNWIYGGTNALSNPSFESEDTQPIIYTLNITATGGTYTLSDGSDTTSSIDWDATESTVETRLEADITAITDVIVEPTATGFTIEFKTPTTGVTLSVNTGSLTGGSATLTLTQQGLLEPGPWTKSQQINIGTPRVFGCYDTFEVTTEQARTGSNSLKINPCDIASESMRYAGVQQVVRVTPGATYQASVWVRSTSATNNFRFVLRTLGGEEIDRDQQQNITANTWTEFSISDLVIPDGVTQLIFRIADITASGSNPAAFYVDDGALNEGLAASTVGAIVNDLMDDATSDHSGDTRGTILTWIDYSGFDDTNDSSSTTWVESLSIELQRGMTYGQVFDKLRDLGYEWRLVPKTDSDSYAAGADTHNLEWYNEDGMGTDYSSSAFPAINVGQSTTSGPVVQRIPDYTAVLVEGAGHAYTEDKDSTAETNFGRFEKYFGDKRWKDSTTRTAVGDQALAEESVNRIAVKVRIVDNPEHPTPLVDFKVGDTLIWQIPPVLSRTARKVRSVAWHHGDTPVWDVTGSKVFPGETGGWEALRVLLRKFQALEFEEGAAGETFIGGGGGMAHVLIVSESEPLSIQEKADYTVSESNSATALQAVYDDLEDRQGNSGAWSIWHAGIFDLDSNVTAPARAWIRGLGYTESGPGGE